MTASAATPPIDSLMLDLFRVELENNTRTLESGLVTAERDQTPDRIEPLMRAAHSIKGAARIVGQHSGYACSRYGGRPVGRPARETAPDVRCG
jgi:hypothetical protein